MGDIRGTWLLQEIAPTQQAPTLAARLAQLAPTLRSILATTDVGGLSLRYQFDDVVLGGSLEAALDAGKAIADEAGKLVAGRTMVGRFCPPEYRGRSMVYDGSATNGYGKGSIIPLPFGRRGRRNTTLFNGMIGLYDRQFDWALANGSPLVHLPWPGLLWAELALIRQMMNQAGYTYEVVRDFHTDLMRYALGRASADVSVEFATSGHVDDPRIRQDIQAVLMSHPNGRYGMLSTNNVDDDLDGLPLKERRWRFNAQMYGTKNTYDWPRVFTILKVPGAATQHVNAYAESLEVYTESFAGGTSGELRRQITAHASKSVKNVVVTPATVAGGVTVASGSPSTGGGDKWKLPTRNVDGIKQLYTPDTRGLLNTFDLALRNTDNLITGFGTRIPAKWLDDDMRLADESKAIADAKGKLYRIRTMMGGHIPDTVKVAMGARFLFDGTGAMAGVKCPKATDGTSLNVVLLDYYRQHVRRVFAWCRANGVDLFNLPTLGMAYSELYYGPEVQDDPDAWLALHFAMVDIAAEEQLAGVTAGWGLSGHGPFFTTNRDHGDMGMQLAQYIKVKMPAPDQAEAQGNGLSPTQIWGQQSSTVEAQMDRYLTTTGLVPGAQAIQPWGTAKYPMLSAPEFAAVFTQVESIEARQVELYLDTPAKATDKRLVPHLEAYLAAA